MMTTVIVDDDDEDDSLWDFAKPRTPITVLHKIPQPVGDATLPLADAVSHVTGSGYDVIITFANPIYGIEIGPGRQIDEAALRCQQSTHARLAVFESAEITLVIVVCNDEWAWSREWKIYEMYVYMDGPKWAILGRESRLTNRSSSVTDIASLESSERRYVWSDARSETPKSAKTVEWKSELADFSVYFFHKSLALVKRACTLVWV